MNESLLGIDNLDSVIILGILLLFGVTEIIAGYLKRTQRTFSDWIQEAGGFLILVALIKPGIVLLVLTLGNILFPNSLYLWSDWSIWLMLPFYLFMDDILQYWYHRSSHEYDFLWKLHRPHHQAEEMGFFISYRNAGLYYLMMPNIWWVGFIVFIGGAKAVAIGLIVKQLIIIGAHSTISWDKPLYKSNFFSSIMNIIERIIITPAFHHAHHGKSVADGVSDPNGNFGNMFSIWDQLFGTAMFTRKFPTEYGLQTNPKEEWQAAYFYPLVKSKNTESEIGKGFEKNSTIILEPTTIRLEKGKTYLWCQCGKSKNQPFCDGMHHGSKFKPLRFEATRTGNVKLCNCKATKAAPFCDNAHLEL
ncbi:MAG: sterol desaturase/sphingolipid hydroxylase (fatty acid hydroxylase superfamily) [Saprospiraceae bacterium]|jgi:sterol desaturase/sphingolipid hydroxylase (fatty acid hydroxylase superfamily)/CDGSH-type Zn-finger protein